MLKDSFGRVHDYLRFSITSKCNFNCTYCNPAGFKSGVEHIITNESIMNPVEINRLLKIFIEQAGIRKIRFTGGEPLLRNDLDEIFQNIPTWKKNYDMIFALSTNGSLLKDKAKFLKNSGIDYINISLDSLKKDSFKKITGRNNLEKVISGIEESILTGFKLVKVNFVLMYGINEDEVISVIERFLHYPIHIRFIEYMPIGKNNWNRDYFYEYKKILDLIHEKFNIEKYETEKSSTSKKFQLENSDLSISFITPMSEHFCDNCNRLRITSSGNLRLCLFSEKENGLEIGKILNDSTDEEIFEKIKNFLPNKWLKHPPMEELAKMNTMQMVELGG